MNRRHSSLRFAPAAAGLLVTTGATAGLSGCNDVRAPLTIVVDVDRSRAAQELEELGVQRQALKGDRAQLDETRRLLRDASTRLSQAAQKGGVEGDEAARLQEVVRTLSSQLGQLERRGGGDGDLDAAFRAHEERVAQIVADEVRRALQSLPPAVSPPVGASSAPAAATSVGGAPPDAGPGEQARRLLEAASAGLRERGLEPADLTAGPAMVSGIRQAITDNDPRGVDLARDFAARAQALTIDRRLAMARYERVNTRIRQRGLGDAQLAEPRRLLGEAKKAIQQGNFVDALRALSAAEAAAGARD